MARKLAFVCLLLTVQYAFAQHQHAAAGEYLFVHAGIRPGVALSEQTLDDLVGIRQPFLWTEQSLGLIVVHGHSSSPSVTRTDNRIGDV